MCDQVIKYLIQLYFLWWMKCQELKFFKEGIFQFPLTCKENTWQENSERKKRKKNT